MPRPLSHGYADATRINLLSVNGRHCSRIGVFSFLQALLVQMSFIETVWTMLEDIWDNTSCKDTQQHEVSATAYISGDQNLKEEHKLIAWESPRSMLMLRLLCSGEE